MSRPTALVYGLAVAGEATAQALLARGHRVFVADDAPGERQRAIAGALGVELVERPDPVTLERLVRECDLVAPAPGVPETHPVVEAALRLGRPLRTEIDLAYEWEQQRPGGPRPMVAVTGTDGKTTTTSMVAALLAAGGHRVAAVGNTELPLIAALDMDVDVFAVECSSFRLMWLERFRAEAAIWLNLAPDHQNWHRSMATYEAAKASIWRRQRADDVAVGWVGDETVMRHLAGVAGRKVTFGLRHADYRQEADEFVGPRGPVASVASLRRAFPHDRTNALAAIAACLETGLVAPEQVDAGLAAFEVPRHRIEPIGEHDGVAWFDDSKATTPHAALTAIRSFESLVLVAGGRNKGLDLGGLASEARRIRAVVAIGEAADEVRAVFRAVGCEVEVATTMADAVAAAARLARPGDAVVLSPACASFDWYPTGGYPARGDDFRHLFEAMCKRGGVPPASPAREPRP